MRRRLVALLVVLLLLAPPAAPGAQSLCPGIPSTLKALPHDTFTISTAAVGLNATKLSGASMAVVQIQGAQPIRYWSDGATTAPTATVGMFVNSTATAPGQLIICNGQVLSTIRFIRDTTATGDATAAVEFFAP